MSHEDDRFKNYLFDVGLLMKDRALEAKKDRAKERKGTKAYMYESGRVMAFNEVISIMQQQAEAFGIPLEELRLDDIDPDRDLL